MNKRADLLIKKKATKEKKALVMKCYPYQRHFALPIGTISCKVSLGLSHTNNTQGQGHNL